MSNQKSEMKAQYCGQQEMIDRIIPITNPQPSLLTDHHEEGVTKVALIQPLCSVHSIYNGTPFHTFFLPLYLTLIIIISFLIFFSIHNNYVSPFSLSLFHSFSLSLSLTLLFNLSLFSSSILPHSLPPPPPPPSHFTLSFYRPFSF